MDQEIRNRLRNVVTQCRKLLEESVSQELEGKYAIFARKDHITADPDAKMTHLTEEDRTARKDILAHFEHIKARGFKPTDALDQLIREIAFTHLNRLCAYKMMEARDVYVGGQKFRESVSRGVNSNGVKFYLADHPDEERLFNTGHQDVAYRHFLDWLGGLLSEEIGVLFSPTDPANRLYPRQKTLDEVLDLLNNGDINPDERELREAWSGVWCHDETIGWVYQYFTPKELRDKARKESAAPRNSYELAFRNQFFTPRFVVEFLTDNTLGRIWYEMQKGNTRIKDQCRYIVRRPAEVFCENGKAPLQNAHGGLHSLTQDELLAQPVCIPLRPKRDPRDLKILDPACGSGHFLLYCFDLLLTIYDEAYADPVLGPKLQKEYGTLGELRRDVPRLILAHNLHGIDIDLRASQIAALALWLRSQRAYQEMGMKKDRPRISRSNIICAEPMPGETEMRREFIGQLEPKVLGQVVEVVFEKMKLAGEAGSLLRIEEEVRDTVAAAKAQWVRETTQAIDRKGQPLLFTQAVMEQMAGNPEQSSLFDLTDITDDQFFEQAESRVIEALRRYSEKAQSGHLQRRLFSDDAERGFAFVDHCHKRFDVVLMNPPFGEMPEGLLKYLTASYPTTKYDLATAFVERAVNLGNNGARLGWISPRTWFSLSLLEPFRTSILYNSNSLDSVLDLGIGVLDTALVETACCVLQVGGRLDNTIFASRLLSSRNKEQDVTERFASQNFPGQLVPVEVVQSLPRAAFGYWFPSSFALHVKAIPRFDANDGDAKQGLATTDDFRFLRCLWEVHSATVGFDKRWVPFAKGGEYEPYFDDIHLVIDYEDDGKALKTYLMQEKGQKHWSRRIASSEYYGRSGLTYPKRTTSDLSLRPLPSGSIFSATGQAIFLPNETTVLGYMGLSYTRIFKQLLELYVGSGDASESGSAARDYTSGILNEMKVPAFGQGEAEYVADLVREAIALRRREFRCVEESHEFVAPALIEASTESSLGHALEIATNTYRHDLLRLLEIGNLLDGWSCRLYGLDPDTATRFLAEEVCPFPLEYPHIEKPEVSAFMNLGMSDLVETLCEAHGYRRAYTKKAYWANRRLELTAHLAKTHPSDLGALPLGDVTRHLKTPFADVMSYCVGVIFGRWDLRSATKERPLTVSRNPFDQIPATSPGMLTDNDGAPATTSPTNYAVAIEFDGILADDKNSPKDIHLKTREVLGVLWSERVDSVEREICQELDCSELREYFRKPGKGGFWDDHLRRYSKSRRNAPIYWLLQSAKKSYGLWFYYRRLDKDMLFKAIVNHVEPKIRLEANALDSLRTQRAEVGETGKEAKRLAKEIERQEDFLSELRDFEDKLRRAANLHLEPDLNDGVVLNIAPLHELVPWKEADNYWEELLSGRYEWSSIGKQLRQKGLVK
jgi:hypothetical protein